MILFISCKKETDEEKALEHFHKLYSAYCTNDIQGAERALLDDFQTLSEYESNRLDTIDYDMARAIDHEELFLIYARTHQTNKMESEFHKSMECLSRYDERLKLPLQSFTYETLSNDVERSDRGIDVRWKREIRN